jgi:hypothetical protein
MFFSITEMVTTDHSYGFRWVIWVGGGGRLCFMHLKLLVAIEYRLCGLVVTVPDC